MSKYEYEYVLVSLGEYLLQISAISFEALLTNSEQIKFSLCLKRNKNQSKKFHFKAWVRFPIRLL